MDESVPDNLKYIVTEVVGWEAYTWIVYSVWDYYPNNVSVLADNTVLEYEFNCTP